MEVLGKMAGGVAHDLNNVLSGIVSYPDLLLLDLPKDRPLHAPLETIKKSGERAAAIVQDLLALARRGVMVRETVSLNDVITDLLQSLEFQKLTHAAPDIEVEPLLDPQLCPIQGSPVHLQKALMNLLVNAFEAVEPPGHISLVTQVRDIGEPLAAYETIPAGSYVVLTIRDSGPGMAPEVLEKMFEPFYSSKPMGRSGTGLGMTVVWGTVKDHKGFIDVTSSPEDGTAISLFFPAAGTSACTPPRAAAEETLLPRGRGETILIVDDMKAQRELAVSITEKLGYRVWAVASGEEAVEFLRTRPVDLVLLDMIMPQGMDGVDTYREISRIVPGQKAIIISGYTRNARVLEALELGIAAHLKKPYTIAEMSAAIHRELSRG
jgi:CheY-like chemotaxis protein